jgi:hypothetical protein
MNCRKTAEKSQNGSRRQPHIFPSTRLHGLGSQGSKGYILPPFSTKTFITAAAVHDLEVIPRLVGLQWGRLQALQRHMKETP